MVNKLPRGDWGFLMQGTLRNSVGLRSTPPRMEHPYTGSHHPSPVEGSPRCADSLALPACHEYKQSMASELPKETFGHRKAGVGRAH